MTWCFRALLALVFVSSCATTRPGVFRDAPPVVRVNDTRDIPEPTERPYYSLFDIADNAVFAPMIRGFSPRPLVVARDINSMDEIPDSTWFENRISARDLSPEEVVRGATNDGPPLPPLTIVSAKKHGNPGFIISDRRSIRYLIKFDTKENPEQQTGNTIIVNRLLWALGYNVPADYVAYFGRGDLALSEKVLKKGITDADIDRMLDHATKTSDGRFRATASRFLSGIPKGGFPNEGTRADDPNDTIAHEHRRSLRALRVFAAWLGHTDIKENNTLDMYVEENGRHFLRHFLVDFGEALGGHQSEKEQPQIGFEYGWDWAAQSRALVSFGLWVRPWEVQRHTRWQAVGYFGFQHFEPSRWKERYPYEPFRYMTAADAFWAAKQVMKFDRAILEAVVSAAEFSEPGVAEYLVEALLERRNKIGAAYLDGVTPLTDFRFVDDSICATDLTLKYGFTTDGIAVVSDGVRSRRVASQGATVCFDVPTDDRYQTWRIRMRRRGHYTPVMELHLKGGSSPRVLGIVR